MSSPSVSRPPSRPTSNTAGRTVLWIAILLTLALLTFITIFTANHNPYVNDVARNKISKYKFIEECKTQFDQFATSVGKSQNAVFTTEYDPKSLVEGAVSNPDPKAAGWVLSSTVAVSRQGLGSQSIPFACQSDANGKVSLVQQSAPQQ
ncbi:hypothetical protein MF271_11065 [Deinococcus sp. KNUC1210]|uniref:hypothetical protein n=1 Tax=Deinococcus sp. KNUC1210 TaxID=2917691 RepID=UPI001EEFC310|nr:hypothetical protein [Deinococcus sp. KNUC1210]ULH14559.1 hypothetical protein MF271_11065 [Deinococcus sp. KNUC1210]